LNPGQGVLLATFWKRVGEKVEAGVGLDVKASSGGMAVPTGGGLMVGGPVGGGKVREGTATFGLKYQFRAATLRAQIDSGGRVTAWLERMLSPQINVTFCGDIDHFKVTHTYTRTCGGLYPYLSTLSCWVFLIYWPQFWVSCYGWS